MMVKSFSLWSHSEKFPFQNLEVVLPLPVMVPAAPQDLCTSAQPNRKQFSVTRTVGSIWSVNHGNTIKQIPSCCANCYLSSPKIPWILGSPKVHYCIQNCPPPVQILSQIISLHILTLRFFKMCFGIGLPFILHSPKWSVFLRFSNQNFVCIFYFHQICYMSHHLILLV